MNQNGGKHYSGRKSLAIKLAKENELESVRAHSSVVAV